MKKDLMRSKDFAEIFETLESYPRKVIDVNTLIQTAEMQKYKIKARTIRDRRAVIREQVEEQLQKMVKMKENFNGTY
jgi:FtsZ-binding cell division protein ZapB